MPDPLGGWKQEIPLDIAIVHFNEGPRLACFAHQTRLRMVRLNPAANRPAFADVTTVVELENRDARERIFRHECLVTVRTGVQVDRNPLDGVDPFFRQKHAHPLGVRRSWRHVKFHESLILKVVR